MSTNKKYWKGVEELHDSPNFVESKNKEFSEYLPAEDFLGDKGLLEGSKTNRRDFLKYLGFGVTAASLAACETPVNKVIPHVVKTDKANPGVANYFATTYSDGNDYAEIIVKTREGRPIKIDGNKQSPLTKGGVNARINSSVLSLYDEKRYRAPQIDGSDVSWSKFDSAFKAELEKAITKGGSIRILTNSISSPSTLRLVKEFADAFPDADIKHVTYDSVSHGAAIEANKEAFGKAQLPSYNLSKAHSIVSVGADFLSSLPNSVGLTAQYAATRKPENGWISKHFQFESSMSLTGSNADVRVPLKPSEQAAVLANLYNELAAQLGQPSMSAPKTPYSAKIKAAAKHLLAHKGESIVFAGANEISAQKMAVAINYMLGNYGNTIDIDRAVYLKQGVDSEVTALVKEMNSGQVDVLMMAGVNPVYNLPNDLNFSDALVKVGASLVFADRPSATTKSVKYIAASHHYLESWNDQQPVKGHFSLAQPTINPLFDTRQMQDCILNWMGRNEDYYTYLRNNWKETAFTQQSAKLLFDDFWNSCLHDGFFAVSTEGEALSYSLDATSLSVPKTESKDWEIEFYQKVGIGDGSQAHNPWLQELPDPISKMTWDNYIAMNPSDAREQGFATEYGEQKDADTINITINGVVFENVPVIAQPGQAKGTLSVAVGYGQPLGKSDELVGFNVYPATSSKGGRLNYTNQVSFEATGETYQVATTQTHQTIMGRDSVVRETDWSTYKNGDKDDYNPPHMIAMHEGPKPLGDVDLWAKHPVESAGHHWGMSIDLSSCIGCGACVTSCNSENNVPVVGKDEVRRSREMHWIRIDRYFSSEEDRVPEDDQSYTLMEVAEDNPSVVHQPMMCQHCNHAPCETVCPVAATTHSNEGINQMTYNRCIGTRYCANNCPYKVRRFNWFNYQAYSKFTDFNPSQDDLGRMVLNPDVTVRARGVMEKCSLCVQRIQEGKLTAKKEGRKVMDGEIQTACSSACPTQAITFGDLNDQNSKVLAEARGDRSYRVIEEVGTQANVYYQVKVRNTESNIA